MYDIERIRADFPILQQKIHENPLVYLDNSATTQKPQQVLERIIQFYSTMNCNVHRGAHYLSQQASEAYESARIRVQQFLHAASSKEIVFTSGTTEAINLVATCFQKAFINKDDEIIISEMEHHSNIVPWQMLCKKTGATLKVVSFDDHGTLDLHDLEGMITDRTKLIAVTYVSNVLGTINPIKKIVEIAHTKEIPVLVDGAQTVQHMPVNVQKLDCDFFVFSGHKIYSETGIGVLYAKEKWLESMPPYQYGGGMIAQVSLDNTTFSEPPFKFEAGTSNIAAAVSLHEALDYVSSIGFNAIKKHETELMTYVFEKLREIKGITFYGEAKPRCGIISFNLKDIHHYDAALILDKLGVAVRSGMHCAELVMDHYNIDGCIRASIALYNSYEDVDRLITGIQKVKEMHIDL